jgi:toxin YoeB
MEKVWSDRSWKEYLHWQTQDKRTLRKINSLIKDIERNEGQGIGKPEQLQGDLSGWSSRRIDEKNRLVYRTKNGRIEISQCRGHYDDR